LSAWAAKKEERQKRILSAAVTLFDRLGYGSTTMSEIAAVAGCGVATVYNYYTTKEGIAAELLFKDLNAILQAGKAVVNDPALPSDPGQAVMALLSVYRDLGGHDWARRDLLRITIFPNLGNSGILTEFINRSEDLVQKQILELLQRLRASGCIVVGIDLDDVTAIIFDIFNQSFGRYLTHDDLKFEEMFVQLSRRIRLLFDNWQPAAANPRGQANG
jgi:AcrR family transcriptional regulator